MQDEPFLGWGVSAVSCQRVLVCVSACGAHDCNRQGGSDCSSSDSISVLAQGSAPFPSQYPHANVCGAQQRARVRLQKCKKHEILKQMEQTSETTVRYCLLWSINTHNDADRWAIFTSGEEMGEENRDNRMENRAQHEEMCKGQR